MASVQVRYIVHDVDQAIAFYTTQLGFKLDMHPAPPFAMLSRGELRLVLSAPNAAAGGGASMPDGTKPTPGGWNRFAIEVEDLATFVERLRAAGARFRNDIERRTPASGTKRFRSPVSTHHNVFKNSTRSLFSESASANPN